jgi:hypothetical protein
MPVSLVEKRHSNLHLLLTLYYRVRGKSSMKEHFTVFDFPINYGFFDKRNEIFLPVKLGTVTNPKYVTNFTLGEIET